MQEYAVKGNREIAINNESEKEALVKLGYDIVDEKGNLIIAGRGKTVPYEQYVALKNENDALKKKNESLKKENTELNAKLKEIK